MVFRGSLNGLYLEEYGAKPFYGLLELANPSVFNFSNLFLDFCKSLLDLSLSYFKSFRLSIFFLTQLYLNFLGFTGFTFISSSGVRLILTISQSC